MQLFNLIQCLPRTIPLALPVTELSSVEIRLGHAEGGELWVARLPETSALGVPGLFLSANGRDFHQLRVSPDRPFGPSLTATPNFISMALDWGEESSRLLYNAIEEPDRLVEVSLTSVRPGGVLQDAAFYLFSSGDEPVLDGALRRWWIGQVGEASAAAMADPGPENEPVTETILYVEDDSITSMAVMDFLEMEGFAAVRHASGGREAMKILEETPDLRLVLSDYDLREERTGLDLAREMEKARPGLRVLFVSGQSHEIKERLTEEERSYFEVMSKPADMEQVCRRFREILKAVPQGPSRSA